MEVSRICLLQILIDNLFIFAVIIYPGSKGTADGIKGDHVLIAPPYTITEEELVFLVDTLKVSITTVFESMKELA